MLDQRQVLSPGRNLSPRPSGYESKDHLFRLLGLLTLKEVSLVTTLSVTTIWRLRRKMAFPEPAILSDGRIGFRISDIDAWVNARPSKR
ncbi:AlpA family phage regulatory protein [Rhizobium leguminosarum bv. viciae]|uniref:AlpA family phage regulatory protein n=1 Tax=Rhizobium leguminosarum bv. viciae TaxID=387 RepID=A0A8I2KGW5_RHILV|nr:AlpA family phage regulatory protein [Rhizobium leguminosarum bv. viciae]